MVAVVMVIVMMVVVVVVVVVAPTPNYLRQASQNLGKYVSCVWCAKCIVDFS